MFGGTWVVLSFWGMLIWGLWKVLSYWSKGEALFDATKLRSGVDPCESGKPYSAAEEARKALDIVGDYISPIPFVNIPIREIPQINQTINNLDEQNKRVQILSSPKFSRECPP